MAPVRIAVIGMGKIARDQHLPAIAGNPAFALAATVSPNAAGIEGTPHFTSLGALLEQGPAIDAVALCTPPQLRYDLASAALARGLHVFLEKPPGATLAEVAALDREAEAAGVTAFASWHSRFAAGLAPARDWLAHRTVRSAEIVWAEDVRQWHPGQDWIWEPGGLGVFDPGINALSIVTAILPRAVFLRDATLFLPSNRAAPIAADLALRTTDGAPVTVTLDWRRTGLQQWDITVETDDGTCRLSRGGATLALPDGTQAWPDREYPGLYARFAELIGGKRRELDIAPLRLVADAFLRGRREDVDAFHD